KLLAAAFVLGGAFLFLFLLGVFFPLLGVFFLLLGVFFLGLLGRSLLGRGLLGRSLGVLVVYAGPVVAQIGIVAEFCVSVVVVNEVLSVERVVVLLRCGHVLLLAWLLLG